MYVILAQALSILGVGARSGGKAPLTQGRQLDCSFQLRLEALKAVRQQLKRKLADIQGGSPDSDLELASKQAPGCATYMALVRNFLPQSRKNLLIRTACAIQCHLGPLEVCFVS